jgi:hypothetical protein
VPRVTRSEFRSFRIGCGFAAAMQWCYRRLTPQSVVAMGTISSMPRNIIDAPQPVRRSLASKIAKGAPARSEGSPRMFSNPSLPGMLL